MMPTQGLVRMRGRLAGKHTVAVRVEGDQHAFLRWFADENDVAMSDVVRLAIRQMMAPFPPELYTSKQGGE